MKTVLGFLIPLLLVIVIFSGFVLLLNQNEGKGALQVTSFPESSVYLEGKLIGNTPLCRCEAKNMLKTGEYAVKIVPKEGDLQPFEEKITIYKSTLTVVDRTFADGGQSEGSIITLSQITDKKDAQILVLSFPEKATVSLDSNPVGSSPLLLKNITESDHDLHLEKEGYKDKLLKIRAIPGYKLTSLVFMGLGLTKASDSAGLTGVTPTPSVQKIVILNTPTGFLRVRADASLGSAEIGRVVPGETFDLLEEKGKWFRIKLNSSIAEGKLGWVSSDYCVKQ